MPITLLDERDKEELQQQIDAIAVGSGGEINRTIEVSGEGELSDIFFAADILGSLPAYGTDNLADYMAKVGYLVFNIKETGYGTFQFYSTYHDSDSSIILTYISEGGEKTLYCFVEFDTESDSVRFIPDDFLVYNYAMETEQETNDCGMLWLGSISAHQLGTETDVTDVISYKPKLSDVYYSGPKPMGISTYQDGSGGGENCVYYYNSMFWDYFNLSIRMEFVSIKDTQCRTLFLTYTYADDQSEPTKITARIPY
jgi:hypothetical protein